MAGKIIRLNTGKKGKSLVHGSYAKKGKILTNKNTRPFVVCFADKLHKD